MPISSNTNQERHFFTHRESVATIPDLLAIQTSSYEEFLQDKVPIDNLEQKGLEAVFRSMFPV